MGKTSAVIHCNRNLAHQVEIARCLKSGFSIHGLEVEISDSRTTPADFHIVMGPWFAFKEWRNHNTLYIDRAYWGDPECVSVHWLKEGEKDFPIHNERRDYPVCADYKSGDKKIYLCDYGDHTAFVMGASVRHHPAMVKPKRPLSEDLDNHDIAIGNRTTALVDAAIAGLEVVTKDRYSPVWPISGMRDPIARHYLLNDLAWHNWSLAEIERGEMWNAVGRFNQTGKAACNDR